MISLLFNDTDKKMNIQSTRRPSLSKLFTITPNFKRNHTTYLLSHHLEKDIKHLIANTNNTLHHACEERQKKGNLRK